MRYGLPSPYREIPHTADAGIEVEGESAEEALARAILAMADLIAGGGPVACASKRRIAARGEDRAALLVDALRRCLLPFFTDKLIPCAVETGTLTDTEWEGEVAFGRYDPERHPGSDIKAVTYAESCLEPRGNRWVARAVFDI